MTISCRPRQTEPAATLPREVGVHRGRPRGFLLFLPLLGGTGWPPGTSWVRGRGWGGRIRRDGAGPAPLPAPGQTITEREEVPGPEPAGSTVPASDSFLANFLPPPPFLLLLLLLLLVLLFKVSRHEDSRPLHARACCTPRGRCAYEHHCTVHRGDVGRGYGRGCPFWGAQRQKARFWGPPSHGAQLGEAAPCPVPRLGGSRSFCLCGYFCTQLS